MMFIWINPRGARSRGYTTEAAARANAIYNARVRGGVSAARATQPLDADLEAVLWKSMSIAGWRIVFDAEPGGTDAPR